MRTYTARPSARRARAVWDHATTLHGSEPESLRKNPNCWMSPQSVGNAWGWWVAEWGHYNGKGYHIEWIDPRVIP